MVAPPPWRTRHITPTHSTQHSTQHGTRKGPAQGHAIEVRINAEDPFQDFRPSPGRILQYLPPGGVNVRMDSHLYTEYVVPPNYDSLLGKLIVWGEDRTAAINRMKRCIDETIIVGAPRPPLVCHLPPALRSPLDRPSSTFRRLSRGVWCLAPTPPALGRAAM